MLLLIHPETGDVMSFFKGEAALAVDAYALGYRGLSDRTNDALGQALERRAGRKVTEKGQAILA